MNKVIALLLVLVMVPMVAVADNELIVTELMYNSPGLDVEWIELYNASGMDLDLTGWSLVDDDADHTPVILSGTLGAGEVLVVAGDMDLFTAQYPDVTNVYSEAFQVNWALGNGGDGVQIFDSSGAPVFSFTYDDGGDWPGEADGDGPSLQLISIDCDDFNDPACWTAGSEWGTPGLIEETVSAENLSFGSIKALFR